MAVWGDGVGDTNDSHSHIWKAGDKMADTANDEIQFKLLLVEGKSGPFDVIVNDVFVIDKR